MTISIPLGLKGALEAGECVLFVGAGIGSHMKNAAGRPAPTAVELAEELAKHFSLPASTNLAKISQLVEIRKTRADLDRFVKQRLADLEPDETLRWITSQRWQAIFTTNYDRAILRAYELSSSASQKPIPIAATSELQNFDPRFEVPIYHIHGAVYGNSQDIVITEKDYIKFRERRRMLFETLKQKFATAPFLYIGYGNQDPNWDLVLNEVSEEFSPAKLPHSYRVAPGTDPVDAEILRDKGIESIDARLDEFVPAALATISNTPVAPDRLAKLKSTVPAALRQAFEKNPAPVARLVASWQYVNEVPFSGEANLRDFLQGDRPNWAGIAQKAYFTRDVEESIFDNLLDFATAGGKRPVSLVLLGPAGYGVTTSLMALAVRLVTESAGPVFYLKPGGNVLEGDVEFAATLFEQPSFFVVDDATDNLPAITSANTLLRDLGKPVFFLLGARKNEWLQARPRLAPKRIEMDLLSDVEIKLLLDFLARHHALNRLGDLTEDQRIAAISQRHNKNLLVTMKEATEGRGFDAIIEDEYRGIEDDFLRTLYLAVCCMYQHGAHVRDRALAALSGIDFSQLYPKIGDALDGVVLFDLIDEAAGIYAARARHRVIAEIVWERCGEPGLKEALIRASLEAINLNFKSDAIAFEQLIRSDHLVDSIRTLDGKISFFDRACNKDPNSPYVRQHYARMLAREKKFELALGQVEAGIEINPKYVPRVLFHTKGVILTELAAGTESLDIARRRLMQAEDVFRKSIGLNPKDGHGYHGLANLYLGWAQRVGDAESVDYISRAEGAVSDGLKNAREKDSLWIVSSAIQEWLGNHPTSLKALEHAVKDAPGSVIARYLLARQYRLAGRYKEAIATLDPVIANHNDEFRSHLEYALSLLEAGEPRTKAIAILYQSTLYGYNDLRYLATLGGLQYLDGQFNEADKVFSESAKRDFSNAELNKVFYRPTTLGTSESIQLTGTVAVTKPGFALIDAAHYPRVLCPYSKVGSLVLRKDMTVRFNIEFSARSAVAVSPVEIK